MENPSTEEAARVSHGVEPRFSDQIGQVSIGMKRGMSISGEDDELLKPHFDGVVDLIGSSSDARSSIQDYSGPPKLNFPGEVVDLSATDFLLKEAHQGKRLTRMETPQDIRNMKNQQHSTAAMSTDRFFGVSGALDFTMTPTDESLGFGETVQAYMDSINKPGPTVIVAPQECALHGAPEHQESPKRLEVLCGENGALRRPQLAGLEWMEQDEIQMAPIADVLRVHEWDYIEHIKNKAAECTDMENELVDVEVDRGIGDAWSDRYRTPPGCLDNDARLTRQSFNAAMYAAGAVINAVDRVASGQNANAFVVIRPPGHHAGPRGCVPSHNFWSDNMASTGFCLLNNVAIGAAYARNQYGRRGGPLQRVAILDFDIHHGNGTQEIIRCLKPFKGFLPLPGGWAPQKWKSYKPWLDDSDPDSVFFCSIHICQESRDFFPGTGLEKDSQEETPNILNLELKALVSRPGNHNSKARLSQTQKRDMSRKASFEFRSKIQEAFLPKLQQFKPDILFLSSGFDGIISDFYHFLLPEDYTWLTEVLNDALKEKGGRIISVLEGGYHLESSSKAKQTPQSVRTRSPSPTTSMMCGDEKQVKDRSPSEIVPEPLIRDTDGGLVQGVLSHVHALLNCSESPPMKQTPSSSNLGLNNK